MKKWLLFIFSLTVILSMTALGCSGGSNPPSVSNNQTTLPPAITTNPPVTTAAPTVLTVTLTIVIEGGGQTAPAAGKYSYPKGTVVNLAAIGDIHWTFNLWIGSVADTRSATTAITMNSDQTVTAYFSATMD